METIKLKVEFWQKVKYSGIIEVSPEEAEMIKGKDGKDVSMFEGYDKQDPVYKLLSPVACEERENDREFEFLDIAVNEDEF